MHRPLTLLGLVALTAASAAPASAAAPPRPWATVNVCDSPREPSSVGVRAFIPRRTGRPAQWLRVRLEYLDTARAAWRPVREGGDAGWARVGSGRHDVMGGTTFRLDEPAAGTRVVVRGVAQIEWRQGRRVVARATVRTRAGHADPSDPTLKVSRRSCQIAR